MNLAADFVTILIWAGSATIWQLVVDPWYKTQIIAQGGVIGFGETLFSYIMLGTIAMILSWFVKRRLRIQVG